MAGYAIRDLEIRFPDFSPLAEIIKVKAGTKLQRTKAGGRPWAVPPSAIPVDQRERLRHDLTYRYVFVPADAVEER